MRLFALIVQLSVSFLFEITIKSEFGYFTDGCFTDRPTLVHTPATGDRQFNKQHQVQNAEDGAINVAVDVLQKS
jgi:hypothetical protein